MEPQELLALMPFAAQIGIALEVATPEVVTGTLAWAPERSTAGGVLHGGVLMTLADSLGGVAAYLNLPPGASTSTIESKTNFFRAVKGGTVRATCRVLHAGRTTMVLDTEVHDDRNALVSRTTQTQAVLTPPSGTVL